MSSKEKCPCCNRIVEVYSDYIDYTLYAYDFSCKCGYNEDYDTGSTCISFYGRWEVFLHHSELCEERRKIEDLLKRRCKVWRRTWWILKPTFYLLNRLHNLKWKIFG